MRRSFALAAASIAIAGTLAACSSESNDSSDEEMVGGMTECTDEIINAEAQSFIASESSGENEWYPDSVNCADGWAVASGINGAAGQSEPDVTGAPANVIFQAEGQFWVPKDAMDVCGTMDGDSYPSDAEIPEDLYFACLSG